MTTELSRIPLLVRLASMPTIPPNVAPMPIRMNIVPASVNSGDRTGSMIATTRIATRSPTPSTRMPETMPPIAPINTLRQNPGTSHQPRPTPTNRNTSPATGTRDVIDRTAAATIPTNTAL